MSDILRPASDRLTKLAKIPKGTVLVVKRNTKKAKSPGVVPAAAAATAANSVAAGVPLVSRTEAVQPPIKSKFIKRGSFGCVVRPALPNKNNDGWHEFPAYITKIYSNDITAEKAQQNSKKIQEIMGENAGLVVHKYRHPYTVGDLPTNIKSSCKIFDWYNKDKNSISVLRQKNLGIDVIDFRENSEAIREYRSLPISKFIEQVQKVFHQVNNLVSKGYIHGDIRETNFLINPITGDFTIIDYDWLFPYEIFFRDYPIGTFYSNPPESLLYENYETLPTDLNPNNPHFLRKLGIKKLEDLQRNYSDYYSNKYKTKPTIFFEYVLRKIKENQLYLRSIGILNKYQFKQFLCKTFDVWGLSLTLIIFLEVIWPSDKPTEVQKIYELLKASLDFDLRRRKNLVDIIAEIDKIVYTYMYEFEKFKIDNSLIKTSSAVAPKINISKNNSIVGGKKLKSLTTTRKSRRHI